MLQIDGVGHDLKHGRLDLKGIVSAELAIDGGAYPEDPSGKLVGYGDMRLQAAQAFANLRLALRAAGAQPQDVTRLGIYVAGYKREYLEMIDLGRRAVFGDHHPTDVLLGVETLAHSEYLIEVEAIAVVQDEASP